MQQLVCWFAITRKTRKLKWFNIPFSSVSALTNLSSVIIFQNEIQLISWCFCPSEDNDFGILGFLLIFFFSAKSNQAFFHLALKELTPTPHVFYLHRWSPAGEQQLSLKFMETWTPIGGEGGSRLFEKNILSSHPVHWDSCVFFQLWDCQRNDVNMNSYPDLFSILLYVMLNVPLEIINGFLSLVCISFFFFLWGFLGVLKVCVEDRW